MSPALLTTNKCPGAIGVARGMTTDTGGPMYEDSTTPPPDHDREDEYAALIKPGDAVETPDGEIWVVEAVTPQDLAVTSAYHDSAGQIYADVYEPTTTTIPKQLARKLADARSVRRP